MSAPTRRTAVVFGGLQSRELRLQAARERQIGLQVMTIEQLACRLSGGFNRAIENETLRTCLQAVLPDTELGELDAIKLLPGMVDACVDTLRKVWAVPIDLSAEGEHPRLKSLAALEDAVLGMLPVGMLRPGELVDAALTRIQHAPKVLGDVDVHGMTEIAPCWRPLLFALAKVVKVRWLAGPRSIPNWLQTSGIEVVTSERNTPALSVVSASTALHEAIEALRWARHLVASGVAKPSQIAIVSSSASEYDDHFLALRSDANLGLHFVHGIKVTANRDGQGAASLADILLRGISQTRFRRLVGLTAGPGGPFADFPDGWLKILPAEAPLSTMRSWEKVLSRLETEHWPNGNDCTPQLQKIVELLGKGLAGAMDAGELLLRGRARQIWRKAFEAGPAAALDLTLQSMREDDDLEACEAMVWMPASSLAASPRPYVRLLGLNSSRWPRRISEDRLLSDHIIPKDRLDPLPVSEADRRDFETILRTTEFEVVLSFSRRDTSGRLLGRSGLLQGMPETTYLRRHRYAEHAFSETDRLLARPAEFQTSQQSLSADQCWHNWILRDLTVHDGLVRANHPVALATLARPQSASSLSLLLRNPFGFLWKYGLGQRIPDRSEEPLILDALMFGNLVHEVLESALILAIAERGAGHQSDISATVDGAVQRVAASWEATQAIPPRLLWRRTLDEVTELALNAFNLARLTGGGQQSFSEVPFGGAKAASGPSAPWDTNQEVQIPDTGFRINGYIDRLDLTQANRAAAVFDYKTGKAPSKSVVLDGGKELQRCLYAYAVKELLGQDVAVSASLLYLRDKQTMPLECQEATLADLKRFLIAARANIEQGRAVPGIAAGDAYDGLAFLLPANAAGGYCLRKWPAILELLADVAEVWEAQ